MANAPWGTPDQVAEWLQVTVEQLAGMRKRKTGPKFTKLDRVTVRYLWADVHSWVAERRNGS